MESFNRLFTNKATTQKKHVNVSALCPFCNLENESFNHVLVTCSYSTACWKQLNSRLNTEVHDNFLSWLQSAFSNSSTAECQLITMLVWAIWKSRNELVWDTKHRAVGDVVVLAKTVLDQWKSAQEKTFEASSELQISDVGYECWRTPTDDTIKVNTDAAIFSHTNCLCFSFVARDQSGSLVAAKSKCMQGKVQPSIVEAIGIREALSWIKDQS
ncbi:hypothetical protein CsatA_026045 [Cannabis sativa]